MRIVGLQISKLILSISVMTIVFLGPLNAQTNVPGPFSVNSVPVLDQTYYSVTAGHTDCHRRRSKSARGILLRTGVPRRGSNG